MSMEALSVEGLRVRRSWDPWSVTSRTAAVLVLILAQLIGGKQPAQAQDFYQGKTIKFIVGATPGGSLDNYTRLISRRLSAYVPGNPSIIVQNMPGAGSLIAANYLYNVTQPDGLTIGSFAAAVVLQQVMGDESAKFDGRKFGWIGTPLTYHSICVVSKESGIKTIEDWLAAKRSPNIGGMAPGAGPSDTPRILSTAIGLPLKLVEGYGGAPRSVSRWSAAKSTDIAGPGKRSGASGRMRSGPENSWSWSRRALRPTPS
jgi:tripartite-type tricarboxylate transporter receptor subunit TctC